MTTAPMIHGRCDPRFLAVRDAFAANFAAGREVGASFAATVEGEPVVDLWGGHAEAATTRPWERDTIVNVFLNKMSPGTTGDTRAAGILAALYGSL